MRIFQMCFSALLQPIRHVTALCVLCLLLAAGTARAQAIFVVNGITYQKLSTSTVQVGNGGNIAIADTRTVLDIPETVMCNGTSYTVTGIGHYAFFGCSSLKTVNFPKTLKNLGDVCFNYCSGLTSLTLPPLVTDINYNAFNYCSGLTSVTLPPSVRSIGELAFNGCSSLTSIEFPETLTSIGNCAFLGCTKMTSVTLPASLTSLGGAAFCHCSSVTAFNVSSANKMFCSVDGVLFNKDKNCLIAYPLMKAGSDYTIPYGVTEIAGAAFAYSSNLHGVILPDTLTYIGESAFQTCSGLTAMYFPESLTSIGSYAFSQCDKLSSLGFPPKLTSIGASAFSCCYDLAYVALPASLTSIGDSAFFGCYYLVQIYYYGSKEPSIGSQAFNVPQAARVLYVPNASSGFTAEKWCASSIVYGAGSLCVTLVPESAGVAGAKWSIDGGTSWNNSGVTLTGLNPGTRTVTYKRLFGWMEPPASSVTIVADQTVATTGTYTQFDMELIGGNFTAGSVTPLTPGSSVDMSWTVQSNAFQQTDFWCEVFASKTGGFDQVRFGSTVTNSYWADGAYGTPHTFAPMSQILKTLPDGAYSLMPVVNRYEKRTLDESNFVNNWTTIAGKRLRVHTTEAPTSDLVMDFMDFGFDPADPELVWILGLVRNKGNKPLPADGCWIEAFYGHPSAEATLDPINTIGAGFNLKKLNPGQETSFSLTGRVPGGADRHAIAAIVDSTDIIPESNEANNSKLWYPEGVLPTPPQNGIDLTVTNVTLDPMQTAPHLMAPVTLFNCSVTVKNNGTVDAGPVWIELFASQDGGVSFVRGATLTDSIYEQAPAPGESKTYSFATMPVKAIGDGMYTIVAVVNRAGARGNPGDSKPLDNRIVYSAGRVSLSTPTQPGTVNLIWSEGPTFTETSGTMTVSGKVKNTGSVASKAFWTEAFTGEFDEHMGFFTRDSVVFAGGVLCESLAPDAEQEITITGPVTPGKNVGILTDSTDLVAETDETDNYDYSELTQ